MKSILRRKAAIFLLTGTAAFLMVSLLSLSSTLPDGLHSVAISLGFEKLASDGIGAASTKDEFNAGKILKEASGAILLLVPAILWIFFKKNGKAKH